jgi:hypothetical protein
MSDTPPGFALENAAADDANAASVSSIVNGTPADAVLPVVVVAVS